MEWMDDWEFAGGFADHRVVMYVPEDRIEHPNVRRLISKLEDVVSSKDLGTGIIKVQGWITAEFETPHEIDEFNEWLNELIEDAKRAGAEVTVW